MTLCAAPFCVLEGPPPAPCEGCAFQVTALDLLELRSRRFERELTRAILEDTCRERPAPPALVEGAR